MRENISGTIANRIFFYSLPCTVRSVLILMGVMALLGFGLGDMAMLVLEETSAALSILGLVVFYYFALPSDVSVLYVEDRVLHVGKHVVTPADIQSIDEMPYFIKSILKIPARVKAYRIHFSELDTFTNTKTDFTCLLLKKYNAMHLLTLGVYSFFDGDHGFDVYGLADKVRGRDGTAESELQDA